MTIPPAVPSASVIILRDTQGPPEILLVRRNAKIAFHGGSWVFPGGKVDSADHVSAAGGDELEVARVAAVREVREEAGLNIEGSSLRAFSHWTTPENQPKRFAAWFFIAMVPAESRVEVDGSEIVDHRWLAVDAALEQRARDEIALPPPAFVSLTKLRPFNQTGAIEHYMQEAGVERFVPRVIELDEGRCSLYQEDAGYESLDLSALGARHRLMMLKSGWEYVKD